MHGLRSLLNGDRIEVDGEFVQFDLDPPRSQRSTLVARPCTSAASPRRPRSAQPKRLMCSLTWPDTVASVAETVRDMEMRAQRCGRNLTYGLRAHMIVRETEAEARAAADRLISKLDADTGETIRNRSLDTQSAGVSRQNELRDGADDDGYAEANLWTGVGRARDPVPVRRSLGIRNRLWPSSRRTRRWGLRPSSSRGTPTLASATSSPSTSCRTLNTRRSSLAGADSTGDGEDRRIPLIVGGAARQRMRGRPR